MSKTFSSLIMVLFWLSSPMTVNATEATADASVTVKGMVCSFCVQGVEKKLLKLDGVEKVTVDLKAKTVGLWIGANKKVTDKQIAEAIQSAGYNVDTIRWKNVPSSKGDESPKAPKG